MQDADFRDIFRVLQVQKEGIEVLERSIGQTTSQLMVMDKEIGY